MLSTSNRRIVDRVLKDFNPEHGVQLVSTGDLERLLNAARKDALKTRKKAPSVSYRMVR